MLEVFLKTINLKIDALEAAWILVCGACILEFIVSDPIFSPYVG